MKKTLLIVVLIVSVGGVLWFFAADRQSKPNQPATPALEQLGFRQLLNLASACEKNRENPDCTRILELLALKSQPQHAKQGETFWMLQMFRLGDWYTYVGTKDYKPGASAPVEVAKAIELYDWVLEEKPFFSEKALWGKARLYHSPWNEAWAAAHRDEARAQYEKLILRFPDSTYAAEATAALSRL